MATPAIVLRAGCPAAAGPRSPLVAQAQGRDERLLRYLDPPDALHPLLAFLLLLEQLALARHVAAVALGHHVLALCLHRLSSDDAAADGRLDRDVEQLAGDELSQLGGHLPSVLLGQI